MNFYRRGAEIAEKKPSLRATNGSEAIQIDTISNSLDYRVGLTASSQ